MSKKPSQGEYAYRCLVQAMENGELPPGHRLREIELSQRLGLSRTPVREALRTLETEGLVQHQPRLGAVVRVLDETEVMELYEMRAVLESTAARLAARMASSLEMKALHSLNQEMAAAPDPHQAAALNRRFHRALVGAARNRFLTQAIESLAKTLLILGPTTMLVNSRTAEAASEHGRVLAALSDRDEARAEAEMRTHIETAQFHRLQFRGSAGPAVRTSMKTSGS